MLLFSSGKTDNIYYQYIELCITENPGLLKNNLT